MRDPEPQTAAGKVHLAFMMSLDGFVAGQGHTMDFMDRATVREGLLQEYIEATGAVLAGRDGYDSAIGDSRPLSMGLVDEIDIHIAPVLLGDGIRLYDVPGGKLVHLLRDGDDPTLAVNLRYRPIPGW
jgi:hypothetical protein